MTLNELVELVRATWEPEDLFTVRHDHAVALGFCDDEAHILSHVGLPNWAAPNLHLHVPEAHVNAGKLHIGEDRRDQTLVYNPSTRELFAVTEAGQQVPVASGIEGLIELLVAYATMVDAALIERGPRACIDNAIPDDLITVFEDYVQSAFANVHTIWSDEIARLRAHSPGT